jgi:phage-related protein
VPHTEVFFYQEAGTVPLLDWLGSLPVKVQRKCDDRLNLLEQMGHDLRRPHADYLRDDMYELRVRVGNVQYRMLYFFFGAGVAVVSHGLVKERAVPPVEIERAMERKKT